MRDFGWSVDSLLKLGYKKEVHSTLSYALDKYSKQKLTTTITPSGKCVDIFTYGIDTLPFLIRSLRVSGAKDLIKKYKIFIDKEVERCFNLCFDKNTSMVRGDKDFSSMKDESIRSSSTYDNVMLAMLSSDLDIIGLNNPFKNFDIKNKIEQELWNGEYFYDDMSKREIVTGDSNVFPFWTGVFSDKDKMRSCISHIRSSGLDTPFPLKYDSVHQNIKMNIVSLFVDGYERDSIWMHMGPIYIELVKKVDKKLASRYINKYTNVIEDNRNYFEVFDSKGKPFKSPFYYSDEGMLWAANYLALLK